MNSVHRYLNLTRKILNSKYRGFTVLFNGKLFCFFFNLNVFMRRKNVRFYFENKPESYYACEVKNQKRIGKRYFSEKFHNYNNYIDGISARAELLGKSYLLESIVFDTGDIVIDCGANVGDLQLWFNYNDLQVEYVGYEASPKTFQCLARNIQMGKTFNYALSNKSSRNIFYISERNADSSLIEPFYYTTKLEVNAKRLDDLHGETIKLLKIDAEGAELEVLEGASKILSKIEYISVDLGFERGVNLESTFVPVTNYLYQSGFDLVDFAFPRLVLLFKKSAL